MLIYRERELENLDRLLRHHGSRLVSVSGSRRVGKTALLVHWAQASQHPYLYWSVPCLPSRLLLREFSRRVYEHAHPGERAPRDFCYHNWQAALEELARICQDGRRHTIVLDEFQHMVAAEPAWTSLLQIVWDHHLEKGNVCIFLCGGPVNVMKRLGAYSEPLYGRVGGPIQIRPLPLISLASFLPAYNIEQRIAVYAMLGGIPAYLEQFSDALSLGDNIKRNLFKETGLLRLDLDTLVRGQVRNPATYRGILTAIAEGGRHPTGIARAAGLGQSSSVRPCLARLVEMDLVRRELPVTVPHLHRSRSRLGRYVLVDPHLRFGLRFIQPNVDLLALGHYDEVEQQITEQLNAFIDETVFPELAQEWVWSRARAGSLPFFPNQIGAYWSGKTQVDVATIGWEDKALLLGATRWEADAVGRDVVRELIEEKTPKVLAALPDSGAGWQVCYAFFARNGFTEDARALAEAHDAWLIDLEVLEHDLVEGSLQSTAARQNARPARPLQF